MNCFYKFKLIWRGLKIYNLILGVAINLGPLDLNVKGTQSYLNLQIAWEFIALLLHLI